MPILEKYLVFPSALAKLKVKFAKQTHRHGKQTYGYQRGKGWGRDKLGVWD